MPVPSSPGRRMLVAALAGIAGLVLAIAASPGSDADAAPGSGCRPRLPFGVGNWPPACWRPYSDGSPFNRVIPKRPGHVRGSARIVRWLLRGGRILPLVAGDPGLGDGNPTYYPDGDDPVYRLHCTENWGRCEIEGARIRVPERARPDGGFASRRNPHDAHMTVVDQRSGWEYDLWQVTSKPSGGGTLKVGWGGRTRIDGDGLGSAGIAAGYGNLAGIVRAQELVAGHIDHALAMMVPCTKAGPPAFPAAGVGRSCRSAGFSQRAAPRLGFHFQLRVGRRRLEHLPDWKAAIARALERYGAYASDTTGSRSAWGFEIESAATYESFGQTDPMAVLGRERGYGPSDWDRNGHAEFMFEIRRGIPWQRMRIVKPCAARGSCHR